MAGLEIKTTLGAVRGAELKGGNGQSVRAFLGVPSGKAERWRKPVPADSWEGVRDATNFSAPPVKPPEVIACEGDMLLLSQNVARLH